MADYHVTLPSGGDTITVDSAGVTVRFAGVAPPAGLAVLAPAPVVQAPVAPAAPAAPAVPTGPSPADTKGIATVSSDSVVDAFGVNTHFAWGGSNYQTLRDTVVLPALADLGVRTIRDSGYIFDPTLSAIKNKAFKLLLILHPTDPVDKQWSWINSNFSPANVWGIEGSNEPTDGAGAAALTKAFFALMAANPAWSGVKRVGPSLINAGTISAAGNMSPYIDLINIHPYPGGGMPEASGLSQTAPGAAVSAPGKRMVATETGYHTDLTQSGFLGVTEKASAIYLPRLLLSSVLGSPSVVKCFFYELLSEDVVGNTVMDHSFGLLDTTGSKRPQYFSMKAYLNALGDSAMSSTGLLDVATSGKNPAVKMFATERADGSFDVQLYNSVSVFDTGTKADIAVADVSETITVARVFRSAKVLRVNDGNTPAWSPVTAGKTISMPVGPGVSILRMTP